MNSGLARHTRSLWLAMLLLTLGGITGALRMPVSLLPQINYPRVLVAIDAGERDPAQMEAEITRPLEVALRAVPGVAHLRSTTSRGTAEIALTFPWGQDMVQATLATQGALATVASTLPAGVHYEVRRSDPSLFPVLGLALTSKNLDPQALRQLAELKIRPALIAVEGVAGVDVLGGAPREFAVDINPAKLVALGVSVSDVTRALNQSNLLRGTGRLQDRHRLYLVLVEHRLASPQDLAAIPIKSGDSAGAGQVTLGNIATIYPAAEPHYTLVNSDGQAAVLINIRQSLGGDTVRIVQQSQAQLHHLKLPASIKLTPFYDQSELVTAAASAVRDAILLGAILAGLVLWLFLRSWRLMAITAGVLPAVLAASSLLLYALGMHFDMMTLGGMAAAVGLIVDDAVVMLEHVMRRLQEGRATTPTSLLSAAAEMTRPLLGSTGATIVVFLPLAFIAGVTGGFFKALAITMVAALIISLLYTRFLVPLLCAYWLRPRDAAQAERAGSWLQWLTRHYRSSIQIVLKKPAFFVYTCIVILGLIGGLAWYQVPSGFMPKMDEGGFILDYKAQPGAALADTDRLLRQVETIIRKTPDVASYSRRTGLQLGGGLTEADEGDYFIRLKGGNRRPIDTVMADIRQQVSAQVPGLQVETAQLMEDLIGDLTAVPQPIEIKLFGDDPAQLESSARTVATAIGKIQGVAEVADGLRVAGDAITIQVDPALARTHGLDPTQVADQLEALIGGSIATQVRVGEQLINVRVGVPAALHTRTELLRDLPLIAPDGHALALGQVAKVHVLAGQKQRTREDLAPFIDVTARLQGRDLGSVMTDVRKTVTGLALPSAIRVEYGGLYAQQRQSFTDMAMVFSAALLLAALLLTYLFERIAWTLAAVTAVLLSAACVFIGLWLTGIELDVSALMGLTMVVGMVTELIVFYLSELPAGHVITATSLIEAGEKRLRPILMSALIAIFTLAPLALGVSRGAGLQQPLATAIIFGLIAAVPLVLLLLPSLLLLLQGRGHSPQAHAN